MKIRIVLAGALAAVMLVSVSALGYAGTSGSSPSAAQYQYKKVTICHKGKNTITISVNAWPAHKRHGDTVGPCKNGRHDNSGHSSQGADNDSGSGHGNGHGKGHSK